jgi:hypothetical protein
MRAALGLGMTARRFPPPWTVEETDACFIVRDANGQALVYVYFEEEAGRRAAAHLLTRDEARRIAANIAELPELERKAVRTAENCQRPSLARRGAFCAGADYPAGRALMGAPMPRAFASRRPGTSPKAHRLLYRSRKWARCE